MLKIAVCVKQVPSEDPEIDWEKGRINREQTPSKMNPDDYHALELALFLKNEYNGVIDAFTLGPPQAEDVLRESYTYGVDNCYLITDPLFAGSDTLITGRILYKSLSKFGPYDVIITGKKSFDGSTGNVSYQLSELFKIPHLTRIKSIIIENSKTILAERIYGHEFQTVRTELPVIIAVDRKTNNVRYPNILNIKKAFEKKITIITHKDLGGTHSDYGLEASPTKTLKGEIIRHKRKNEVVKGTLDDKIEFIVKKLKKYNLIG